MPEILIYSASSDPRVPDKWEDRALVWIEYLVRMEGYDRSLPGEWVEQADGPRIWLITDRDRLRDSYLNAQRHHRRALLALQVLLGRGPMLLEESAVMQAILDRLPTHEARSVVLGERSPATELLGPDLFGAPVPQPG